MEIIINEINYLIGVIGILVTLYGYYMYVLKKKKEYSKYSTKSKIEEYQKCISSKDFNVWVLDIIKKLYDVESLGFKLVSIGEQIYPSIYFLANHKNSQYPFNGIMKPLDLNNIKIDEMNYESLQKEYSDILEGTIKRPKLIGYALNELEITNDNKVVSVSSNICNYEQNVMTSHILEYELYKLYKKNKFIVQSSKTAILSNLKFINNLHSRMTLKEMLFTGKGRHSLLSVQMIVLFKTREGLYKLLLMQRSKDVAAKPNYWQFMPAGGFEMFEKEDVEDKIAIKSNYNLKMAIFREFIEELYGQSEYEYNSRGNPAENILRDPHIIEIENLIKKNKVHMEFLGSAIDLVSLRHELSFILRIDDFMFTESDKFKFDTNHEIHNMYEINIDEVDDYLNLGVMVPSNAALYIMAKDNHLFKEALSMHEEKSM